MSRRSPLDHIHVALGARWQSGDVRWPESYADPAAELDVIERAVGVAELADKLLVRGPRTQAALLAVNLASQVGQVRRAGPLEAWTPGADEVLVVVLDTASASAAEAATRLRATGASVTDLSSGLTILRLVGPSARSVLQEVCPVDVADVALADQGIVQAPVAGIRALFARQDGPSAPGFTLLVARDEAEYLWEALLAIGARHGIRPVGGAAARPALPPATPATPAWATR